MSVISLSLTSCSGCSRKARQSNQCRSAEHEHTSLRSKASKRPVVEAGNRTRSSTIKMTQRNGVYFVPIEVNGTPMEFIFDTGASDICISLTEALFLLKQGTLDEQDIIGVQNYQIADGSIVEGTKIILRKVQIGNYNLTNVEASVSHNLSAPLLLGQSALARFGKISIDYDRSEICCE